MNLKIYEVPNLTVNGIARQAASYDTLNEWRIMMNTTFYGSNMSQEAWGQIILHEILHGVINKYFSQYSAQGVGDHLFMFKNLVTPVRDLLVARFGMDSLMATKLSLAGIRNNWSYGNFEQLCLETYSVGLTSIDSTFDAYTTGTLGKKCN